MNTDAFFAVGRLHHVCQDYALAGPDFVALSDGCSSSPHTDFGSRLMCRMAALHGPEAAVHRAGDLLAPLGLPDEALDATLLFAKWEESTRSVRLFLHGDGLVVSRYREGGWVCCTSSFPKGAPMYPSYSRDPDRKRRYIEMFGGRQVLTNRTQNHEPAVDDEHDITHDADSTGVTVFEAYADIFDLVLVLSDGALTFRRPVGDRGQTEAVPVEEVLSEMLAVKTFAGEFITRRARRFLKDVTAKGWHHDDDFSVAAIHLGAP